MTRCWCIGHGYSGSRLVEYVFNVIGFALLLARWSCHPAEPHHTTTIEDAPCQSWLTDSLDTVGGMQ